MSLRTMRLRSVPCAPLRIDEWSDSLQVRGIHARRLAAEMVNLQAAQLPIYKFSVEDTVGILGNAIQPESPIALAILASCPPPATRWVSVNLRPEACRQPGIAKEGDGTLVEHRKVTPFGVVQPVVSGHAAAFIIQEEG